MADIPESAISEKFLAGSGPGGQNVNKVATACQLRVDVFALRLPPDTSRDALSRLASRREALPSVLRDAIPSLDRINTARVEIESEKRALLSALSGR